MSYGWEQQQQQQHQYGGGGWDDQSSNFSYDMGSADFGQDQAFQSFEYGSQATGAGGQAGGEQQASFFTPGPSIMTPGPGMDSPGPGTYPLEGEEDEPPLLEELGINPDAILQKTLTVLNPLRRTDPCILQDTDLAGPLAFCLALGSFLLLSGKAQFGYIYGIGMLGCASMYGLLNAMSMAGVGLGVVVSVLGYCLLPMVALAGVSVLMSLRGAVGVGLTAASIIWCSISASKLFVTSLAMDRQQPLVAYPCALLYAVFALITIF
ncbi:protein YIPF5-like [Portunus trituberculatus]|uniref:Protein YIPF5 n=1 Tax=Portunus trituberculatus TaxID=210409 RepID=A0A5B7EQU2_PORTR|nr:protein YIPF5-like [Portunus trituberculatus]MPC35499.1 Protein YIPF5 [Portunus trituberculatus]